MKELETLKQIRRFDGNMSREQNYRYDQLFNAITELERLQKKEIPMKVIVYDDEHAFECSNCINHGVTDSMWLFTEIGEYDYCPRCGQRLSWE